MAEVTDEALEALCYRDPRNPMFLDFYDPEEAEKPRDNCYCDNCFSGKDLLALEILRLRERIKGAGPNAL